MNFSRFVLFTTICLFLTGCPPKETVTLINASRSEIRLVSSKSPGVAIAPMRVVKVSGGTFRFDRSEGEGGYQMLKVQGEVSGCYMLVVSGIGAPKDYYYERAVSHMNLIYAGDHEVYLAHPDADVRSVAGNGALIRLLPRLKRCLSS